jgi:hypothetical protein
MLKGGLMKYLFILLIAPVLVFSRSYAYPYYGQIESSGQTQPFTISPGSKAGWKDMEIEKQLVQIVNPSMTLYPNPCHENINISINAHRGSAMIAIYDISGKMVKKIALNETRKATLTEFPASGFYFMRLYLDARLIETKRFLVMR